MNRARDAVPAIRSAWPAAMNADAAEEKWCSWTS